MVRGGEVRYDAAGLGLVRQIRSGGKWLLRGILRSGQCGRFWLMRFVEAWNVADCYSRAR
jgi:hypothetical protein